MLGLVFPTTWEMGVKGLREGIERDVGCLGIVDGVNILITMSCELKLVTGPGKWASDPRL